MSSSDDGKDEWRRLYDLESGGAWDKLLIELGGQELHDAWWDTHGLGRNTMRNALKKCGLPHDPRSMTSLWVRARFLLS